MEQAEFLKFKDELTAVGVTLVAVSKTKPEEDILRLYNWGHRDFGENYVQELTSKQEALPKDIHWHFIGHLQRNKVKYIAPFVHLIHGVDSERLLKEINKEAVKNNRAIAVLLQVFIADEETKFGLDRNEVMELTARLNQYSNVKVRGLMGMATFTEDMEQVRKEFQTLKTLFDDCRKTENGKDWDTLSMGMSADYKVAVAEGSTMVRIGTLLFGKRI
ncbi:MAG: YggS family pyridoxal phosphate-dependent enzyme [Chitinophagaceae bacterium]|nr:YggS family pyridoxal phosphate-dependent enzyme [Chitinophagaceae bacterium]